MLFPPLPVRLHRRRPPHRRHHHHHHYGCCITDPPLEGAISAVIDCILFEWLEKSNDSDIWYMTDSPNWSLSFKKISSIIKEERGVVVQTINLLSALETISLLLNGGLETDPSSKKKCSGPSTNVRRRKSMGHVALRCAVR
uniref:Uncharacterized protein n=1 Tax=Tanacetum cinerariifolium TaxID=118510 RepID=A0A6L2LSI7_TANCI|nr:hypothetical protein [Tanacetum cinerariifolium]